MPKPPRDPFDLPLSKDQTLCLGHWLVAELQSALNARGSNETEVDYWHQLYEQARTRGKSAPWPDAADLTSYLASEKCDAIHARILRTIWTDPVWSVSGYGPAADRAPFVEEFHQWKAEEERLQSVLDRLAIISLIEPRGLLEISEGTDTRQQRKRITAKVQTNPFGAPMFDEQGEAQLETDPQTGKYAEAGAQDLAADTVVDAQEPVRSGPVYRILPYRDSVILPGHARDKADIRGYGKRFWRLYPELQRQAAAGVYDPEAVRLMTTVQDKEPDAALERSRMGVQVAQDGVTAEKELWELTLLLDLNALFDTYDVGTLPTDTYDGARWYVFTIHEPSWQLLRAQHDDVDRARYVPVILFPRPDRATEGFSFIGHKLITTIEEHTAWRNMIADKCATIVQAPLKRQVGALWDPSEQPFGPKAVIDVRAMNEIEPLELPELGLQAAVEREAAMERTAERLSGINDIASGQVSSESRTLGEISMATEQSFVRMDLIVRRFQEAMEDIAQIRHVIWKRCLAEHPEGYQLPQAMAASLEGRGVSIDQYLPDGKITAQLLDGAFRFKPYGNVQTADPAKRRTNWVQFLQILPQLQQTVPLPNPNPVELARAIWRETLRVFDVENKQAFLGSPAQDLQQSQLAQLMPMLQAAMGGQPGLPPGPGAPGMAPPMGGQPPAPPGMPPLSPMPPQAM